MDWKGMLSYISGSVDEELLLRNEYLVAENRVLRNQLQAQGEEVEPSLLPHSRRRSSGTRSRRSYRQGLPNQGDARRRTAQPVPHWPASSSTRPATG